MAATPISAANTASTTRMPATRTVLSLAPNAEMAKFFTGAGVASMAAPPTATTGEPCGPVIPATSCATARARTRPGAAPWAPEDDVTSSIRSRLRRGLPDRGTGQAKPGPATNDICRVRTPHDRGTARPLAPARRRKRPGRAAGPGRPGRPGCLRHGLRPRGHTGLRPGPPGGARPGAVGGGDPGGHAGGVADRLPLRPAPGERDGVADDRGAPPGGGPGALRAGRRAA